MSLVSPLESRERAKKRRDSKSTEAAHTREKVYLDSMYKRLFDEKAGKEKADVREEHCTRGTVREDLLGEAEKDRGDQTVKGCEKKNTIDDEGDADIGFCELYGEKRE